MARGRPKATGTSEIQEEIFLLYSRGSTVYEIADALDKPVGTITGELSRMKKRINAKNNAQAALLFFAGVGR